MLSLIAVFVSLMQTSSESSETERSETLFAAHGEELPELHAACAGATGMNFFSPRLHTSTLSCPGMSEALVDGDDYEGTDFLFLVTDYSGHEKGQEN